MSSSRLSHTPGEGHCTRATSAANVSLSEVVREERSLSVDVRDPRLNGGGADQPTVLASMWKHRMVMAASIVVFAAAAVVVTTALGRDYASRSVADPVAILKSRDIADRAREIARSSAAHVSIDRRTIFCFFDVASTE